jgi:hypothetical protein
MSMRDNGSVTYLMALATKSSQMETNSTVNSCWERSKGRASISGSRDNFKYTEGISATTKWVEKDSWLAGTVGSGKDSFLVIKTLQSKKLNV